MTRAASRMLMYGGILAIVLGIGKMHASSVPYDFTGSSRFIWSLAYAVGLGLAAYALGLPDLVAGRRSAVWSSVVASLVAAAGVSVVQLFVGDALLPRFVVFLTPMLAVPFLVLCSRIAVGGQRRAAERDRLVVVADANDVATLQRDLGIAPERPAQVVGQALPLDVLPSADEPAPLVELARRSGATVLVLARSAQADEIVHQAAVLHEGGMRVRTLALFYEEWLGKLPASELERLSLMYDVRELHRAVYARATRLIDLLVALIGVVALVGVLPFVVVGDLLGNRGRVFYTQPRVGRNGSTFDIVKFRTMRSAGDARVNEWTSENDPRITPFGRVLRRTHLDELPQVVNVARGDLAVVGPRPEQPHYVEQLVEKLPFYNLRHLVRPGLTGWAQVKYGYAGNETDSLEKLQYDFYYLRNQRLSLDLRIIGRTFRSVFVSQGR